MSGYVISSDIGGTFTDTVVIDDTGAVKQYKAPTTHENLKDGVFATLELAAGDLDIDLATLLSQVSRFSHGTTVATNAVIERQGARVGLVQTKGFGDTMAIMLGGGRVDGRSAEELRHLGRLTKPSPLVDTGLTVEVQERIDVDGNVIVDLTPAEARRAVQELLDKGADSIAVSLLWSFQNPVHEQMIREAVEELAPGMFTSISSDLIPRIREYPRTSTTTINSYVGPILKKSLGALAGELTAHGLQSEPFLMQSSGGLSAVDQAVSAAASTLLSGPAGGVAGAAHAADLAGYPNVVTADMGGTSFDVGLVVDGQPVMATSYYMAQYPVALPAVNIHTIGAGGGSIAAVEEGFLQVGPRSAGSLPGPACFGKGGTEPTVTDANLVLGFIEPDARLGGKLALDRSLAVKAIEERIARPLRLDVLEAAAAIRMIADNRMVDLIREVTIARGYDPRDFALVAFGGGGPTHAAYLAAEAGIGTVLVPNTAAVHSAYGIATSVLRATAERSVLLATPAGAEKASEVLPLEQLRATLGELADAVSSTLSAQGGVPEHVTLEYIADVRLRSQIHELSIPLPQRDLTAADLDSLPGDFVVEYEARFGEGSALPGAGIELVTLRVNGYAPTQRDDSGSGAAPAQATAGEASLGNRDIYLPDQGKTVSVTVLSGDHLATGSVTEGPAVIELSNTSVFVGVGQESRIDERRNIVISTKGAQR